MQSIAWWSRAVPWLERNRAQYGNRFTVRLVATPPMVMLADPGDIKEVHTAPPEVLQPGRGANVIEPVVGKNSVILLDGDAHLEQRKLMLPAFHGEQMRRLAGLMESVAESETAGWPSGEPTRLHPRLQTLTLEVILRTVFGLEEGEPLDALRDKLTAVLAFGSTPLAVMPVPEGMPGPWRTFVRRRAEVDELLYALIHERRDDPAERDDILAMLLDARHEDGSPMSDVELRDELMTLLVAGHETTASQLAWAFERLVRTPAVLRRLIDEVDSGDDDAYLTATVQETLRRRPVLPNNAPRYVVEPVEIGGWRYPADCALAPCAYLVHHDPAIYPDPYAFRPERFLEEPPGTYTWIPFGGGRRRCLGASFALMEMKTVLRAVLRRWDVSVVDGGIERSVRRAITLSPGAGARATLRPRATPSPPQRRPRAPGTAQRAQPSAARR